MLFGGGVIWGGVLFGGRVYSKNLLEHPCTKLVDGSQEFSLEFFNFNCMPSPIPADVEGHYPIVSAPAPLLARRGLLSNGKP